MPTIPQFDPPALLSDFDSIPGHRDAWSDFISSNFDDSIASVEARLGAGNCQYYNETKTPTDTPTDIDIIWDAFPKSLVRQFGRATALVIAEQLGAGPGGFQSRVQDEYCEWRVTRDLDTGKIIRVTYTCEGPEYWASMAGGQQPLYGIDFGPGDPDVLVQLYRDLLGNNNVVLEDLLFGQEFGNVAGSYNPWNKWNTTDGLVHLQQRNNTLSAEIQIGADATILREKGGTPVVQAAPLICCGGFGGVNRSSDPTIGDEVNQLAAGGWAITLRNPIGIYFNKFTNSGITKPGPNNTRIPADNYWKPLRGAFDPNAADPGDMTSKDTMVVRAVYEVPPGELDAGGNQLTVSDLQIGGSPIVTGSQLAEKITMKFIGRGTRMGSFSNSRLPCESKCCLQQVGDGRTILRITSLGDTCQDVFPALGGAGPLLAAAGVTESFHIDPIPRTRAPS